MSRTTLTDAMSRTLHKIAAAVAHDHGLVRFSLEGDVVAMSNKRETASACWLGNSTVFEGAQLHAAIIFEERPPDDLVVDLCWTVM